MVHSIILHFTVESVMTAKSYVEVTNRIGLFASHGTQPHNELGHGENAKLHYTETSSILIWGLFVVYGHYQIHISFLFLV